MGSTSVYVVMYACFRVCCVLYCLFFSLCVSKKSLGVSVDYVGDQKKELE